MYVQQKNLMGGMFVSFIKNYFNPQHLVPKEHRLADDMPTSKEVLHSTMAVAWPAIVESFLVALVSLVDNMMVSGIGPAAIAAVGLSTQPRFVLLALFMSLNVGITSVVARRKGEMNQASANHVLSSALKMVVVGSIIATVLGILVSEPAMKFMGAQEDSLEYAVTYFEILVCGMLFNTVSLAITAAQRGCGNTKISMYTNIAANLVNLVGNWLLINGNLGFPRWGVAGAALATVIGQFVAMCMAIGSLCKKDGFLNIKGILKPVKDERNNPSMMTVAVSAATEQVFMRIGFIIFNKIAAGLGTVPYATHQVCQNFMTVSFSFGDGLSIAASSLVGQNLGKGRPDFSLLYGKISQRIGLIFGVSLTVFFLSLRHVQLIPFSTDPSMVTMGASIMIILAFICPGQISQVVYSGALRVAGDAKFVARTSLICITFVRTFVAWLFCYPLGFGIIGIWFGFIADQYLRLILNMGRFWKGKWMQMQL